MSKSTRTQTTLEELTRPSTQQAKASYAAEAADILRQTIVTGNLRPNERLIESAIAKKLGMSRTPVREALKQLEMQGYLSRLPNGGLVVTDHTPNQIRSLYEIREALETMAMKLACQRATAEQIEKVEQYHERSIEIINKKDINAFIELNSTFHNELFSACGNEQLLSLLQTFRDQFFDRRLVRAFNAKDWRTMVKHHQRLLDAVRKRDIRLAEKAVHEHVKIAMRIALERL